MALSAGHQGRRFEEGSAEEPVAAVAGVGGVATTNTPVASVSHEPVSSPAQSGTSLPQIPQGLPFDIKRMPVDIVIRSSNHKPYRPTVPESFDLAAVRTITELEKHVAEVGDRVEAAFPSSKTASLLSRICYQTGLTRLWNSAFPVMAYDVVRDEPSGGKTPLYRVEISRKLFSHGCVVSFDAYKEAGVAGESALERAAAALDSGAPRAVSPNAMQSSGVDGLTAGRLQEPSEEVKRLAAAARDMATVLKDGEANTRQEARKRGLGDLATQEDIDNLDKFSDAASREIEDRMRDVIKGNYHVQRQSDGTVLLGRFNKHLSMLSRWQGQKILDEQEENRIQEMLPRVKAVGALVGSACLAAAISVATGENAILDLTLCGLAGSFFGFFVSGVMFQVCFEIYKSWGLDSRRQEKFESELKQGILYIAHGTEAPLGKTLAELVQAGFRWKIEIEKPNRSSAAPTLEVKLDIFPPEPDKA